MATCKNYTIIDSIDTPLGLILDSVKIYRVDTSKNRVLMTPDGYTFTEPSTANSRTHRIFDRYRQKNTALPIDGTGTHAVLTGHRGYAGAKLFTDLDQLVMGDCFYLHVLDKTLTYEEDQILVVTPDQTEALKPVEGQDFVTLLTCTPYQINSHRLLVRGKRIKVLPAEVKPETMKEPIPVKELLFSFVSLVGIAAGIWYFKRRKKCE